MTPTRVARLRCWLTAVLICAWAPAAAAQDRAGAIAEKLDRAGVIDNYFPQVALEVASTLAQAAPGRWQGVQVNERPRPGWLHIYLVDAQRLPADSLLADQGIENFTADDLKGGAAADEDSASIFLNTAMWKRLTAATVLKTTKLQSDLTAALAAVDALGPDLVQKLNDPTLLSSNAAGMQSARNLMRGALAFVLAHEMGHLLIGRAKPSDEASQRRLSTATKRQLDESRACPELLPRESREDQKIEYAADMAAVGLLGRQCQIGANGKLQHAIYLLGMGWYFTAAMGDKLLDMGRNTDSPNIARFLRQMIGDQLYDLAVAARAAEIRRGAVKFAYPSTHPPDAERMRAIETALRSTPCGGSGLSTGGAQMMEMYRARMCSQLIQEHAR